MNIFGFLKSIREFFKFKSLEEMTPEDFEHLHRMQKDMARRARFETRYNPASGMPMCGGVDSSGNTFGSSGRY